MMRHFISIICIFSLVIPGMVLYAQDEIPEEKKSEESKSVDTAPAASTVMDGSKIDSVKSVESLPESLSTVPAVPQPVTSTFQLKDEIRAYEFKGTGRDIVIGAAVLAGWLVVAFLAANQRSE